MCSRLITFYFLCFFFMGGEGKRKEEGEEERIDVKSKQWKVNLFLSCHVL